mgnify:CR=1 FL=1|tara:strand:- start:1492 stop:1761 length:270 start_codon:yes stop_codon:yes gene_type:complete
MGKGGLNTYQRYIAGRPEELKKHSERVLKYYDPEKVLVQLSSKYENDAEWREKKKQYNKERYHKKKAEKEALLKVAEILTDVKLANKKL